MKNNELRNNLEKFLGWYSKKISFLSPDEVTLLLSKSDTADNFDLKIVFNEVLGFHDTGILNVRIDFIDINLLGFKYLTHAREQGHDPNEFMQVILMGESHQGKIELLIACKAVSTIRI